MFTKIRLALCALALTVPGGISLADPPGASPRTGHVLLLDNDRILEGDIERVGDQYCIRRSIGETWMAADKVQCLCGSLVDAYQFLRSRANLDDADEHLRLARWCQLRGLRSQALAEAAAAVDIRPDHAESRRYLNGLQRLEANAPAAPKTHEEPEPEVGPPAALDFNTESLGMFVTRVQPVLMNACASCHTGNRGGSFHLTRTFEGELNTRRATQQNLAAVMGQVNRERPQESPVLLRAVTVHGSETDQPPIKNRQAPAYRILEEWVQWALRSPVHEPATTASAAPAERRLPSEPAGNKPATPTVFSSVPTASPPASVQAEAPPPQPQPTPPPTQPPAGPADPFDPSVFNQQFQGEHR
jgi:hypothetical protein